MRFDQGILWIMAIGILAGGIDKIMGNKIGLGERFDEGFNAMGPLALGMVGIICLAPVIANGIKPIVVPFFSVIGADPALLGSIFANDMGGYSIAMELARNEQAGLLSGSIVASMLGCTIVFSIPVGFGLIEKEDKPHFTKGLLIGLITIPLGSVVGGFVAGFDAVLVIKNTIPVAALSILLAIGLKFIPNLMIKGAMKFGRFLSILIYVGLAAAAFQEVTGIILIPGMAPIMEGMTIVANIGIVLLGTFPILTILVKILNKPLNNLGRRVGLDSKSLAGLIFSLANSVPVYKMMKEMSVRGKIVNTAWLVPATAALGDQLGFTASTRPDMLAPLVIGKISAGLLAIVLAIIITKNVTDESSNRAVI